MKLQIFGVHLEHTCNFFKCLVRCVTLSIQVLSILKILRKMFNTRNRLSSSRKTPLIRHKETNSIEFRLNIKGFGDVLLTILPFIRQHGENFSTFSSFIVPHSLCASECLFVPRLDIRSRLSHLFASDDTTNLHNVSSPIL